MNAHEPIGLGILGCGNIAAQYVDDLRGDEHLRIVAVTDLDPDRAHVLAERAGGARVHPDAGALLADDEVEIAVNLTIHHAHYEVTRRCLEAGRHVFSEKPLAMSAREAWALVELAERQGVRLAGAPMTFLGDAQQTALKTIRDGGVGTVRLIYAEMNHGRIERWHPSPASFYQVGPLWDVGVYPLMLVTAGFGPIRRVQAMGATLLPDRLTQGEQPFEVIAPDWSLVLMELDAGPTVRMTNNFYVEPQNTAQQGVEFHGDAGSVHVGSAFMFNAAVRVGAAGQPMEPIERLGGERNWIRWGRGLREMARAMREDRPHPCDGAHAAHVVDVLEAADRSRDLGGQPIEVDSSFPMPEPMPWAR